METKETLVEKTEIVLEDNGYNYCRTSGCFDITASNKGSKFILKVITNVDSLQAVHSDNISAVSSMIGASPAVIGINTRRERLEDDVMYERFCIPVFTLKTFANIISTNNYPLLYRFRGGMYASMIPEKLKAARKRNNMSQSRLAEMANVSKKNIYEHEHEEKMCNYATVRKLEIILNESLSTPVSVDVNSVETHPQTPIEKHVERNMNRMGLETSFVKKAPFNVIVNTKTPIIASAGPLLIEKNASDIAKISEVTGNRYIMITETEKKSDFPLITTKQLEEISTPKKLINAAKKGF